MFLNQVAILIFAEVLLQCSAEFTTPEVTFEAYTPKGFRASIPALPGIQLFAFHMNVNKKISQVEPGDYNDDFTSPGQDNVWSYFNEDLSLKVGDKIYYWTFLQYEKLGYRTDSLEWVVPELIKLEEKACKTSSSVMAKRSIVCQGSIILEEQFNGQEIDYNKWTIEEYIPYMSEDYEFVSYRNKSEICYVQGGRLFIKPKAAEKDDEIRGELDLRNTCTRQSYDECYLKQDGAFILPPVISGRIISKTSFRYGKVEIKAKLPAGDWIYPQVYLEQLSDPNKKLWIAYSRGNVHLYATNGEDIGGHLLFGGPVLQSTEPLRSTYLKTKSISKPFSSQLHTYALNWNKEGISLLLDGVEYGKIDQNIMEIIHFSENDMVRLVLGIGVGGINDFPDDFRSGDDLKPWKNKERTQVKNFFNSRNKWLSTWSGDKSALQIEYIKIIAL